MIWVKNDASADDRQEYKALSVLILERGRFGSCRILEWEKEENDASWVNKLSTSSTLRPTCRLLACFGSLSSR
jgi:hypothetical protein